jgi:phosphopantothenoylcysteine decarboxylase/phosphopantothenate--cysteine ligase
VAAHKLKKTGRKLLLELTENPDIVADVAALKKRPFVVGFAAETEKLERHARGKLERKKLDLIAANRVGGGAGFDADDNELTLLWPGGRQALPKASKHDLADALIARIVALRTQKSRANKPGARRR